MAKCIEKGITKRYIKFALRQDAYPGMPLAFVRHKEGEASIVSGEADVKNTMREIGEHDLGIKPTLWFRSDREGTLDHTISRDDHEGAELRHELTHGEDSFREKTKQHLPRRYGKFIDAMKRKATKTAGPATLAHRLSKEAWTGILSQKPWELRGTKRATESTQTTLSWTSQRGKTQTILTSKAPAEE